MNLMTHLILYSFMFTTLGFITALHPLSPPTGIRPPQLPGLHRTPYGEVVHPRTTSVF